MKLAYALVTHNDLAVLSRTLPYWLNRISKFFVIDQGSTDGTVEFLEEFVPPSMLVLHRSKINQVPVIGFGAAYNAVFDLVPRHYDWILRGDSDCFMLFEQQALLYAALEAHTRKGDHSCFGLPTLHLPPVAITEHALPIERSARALLHPEFIAKAETHRRIFKPGATRYRGYIHEEAYFKLGGIATTAMVLRVPMLHLNGWVNTELREARCAWMMLRAAESGNGHLRDGTNDFWYATYIPQHLEELRQKAARYDVVLDKLYPVNA